MKNSFTCWGLFHYPSDRMLRQRYSVYSVSNERRSHYFKWTNMRGIHIFHLQEIGGRISECMFWGCEYILLSKERN